MSQKTEQEETLELKAPPPPETLCPDNCKIPTTCNNSAGTGSGSTSLDPPRPDPVQSPPPPALNRLNPAPEARKSGNRCICCAKRVGLTGFRCRCGELFCSVHRYTDRHDCSFDYKTAGREVIARENPVVRAAKILKV